MRKIIILILIFIIFIININANKIKRQYKLPNRYLIKIDKSLKAKYIISPSLILEKKSNSLFAVWFKIIKRHDFIDCFMIIKII